MKKKNTREEKRITSLETEYLRSWHLRKILGVRLFLGIELSKGHIQTKHEQCIARVEWGLEWGMVWSLPYLLFAAGHEGMAELHAEVGFGLPGQKGELAEIWVTGRIGNPLESMGHVDTLWKWQQGWILTI